MKPTERIAKLRLEATSPTLDDTRVVALAAARTCWAIGKYLDEQHEAFNMGAEEVERLAEENRALRHQVDRLQRGNTIESDFITQHEAKQQAELDGLREALTELRARWESRRKHWLQPEVSDSNGNGARQLGYVVEEVDALLAGHSSAWMPFPEILPEHPLEDTGDATCDDFYLVSNGKQVAGALCLVDEDDPSGVLWYFGDFPEVEGVTCWRKP